MTHTVSFRPEAEADLFALYTYIADDSGVARAGAYLSRIRSACMNLASFPMRGMPRDDLAPGVRSLSFEGRALIFYRVDGNAVRIARVFYAGRDYEASFRSSET